MIPQDAPLSRQKNPRPAKDTRHRKLPKERKCKHCPTMFVPDRPGQKVCGWQCAHIDSAVRKARGERLMKQSERKEYRARKEAAKPRKKLLAEAKYWLHRWIRLVRDGDQPCISCGTRNPAEHLTGGSWDAGHYVAVGANKYLELEPRNIHKQCKRCNDKKYLGGNQSNYRLGLLARAGQAEVDWLEGPHEAKHYTGDDLRGIRDYYKQSCKEAGV